MKYKTKPLDPIYSQKTQYMNYLCAKNQISKNKYGKHLQRKKSESISQKDAVTSPKIKKHNKKIQAQVAHKQIQKQQTQMFEKSQQFKTSSLCTNDTQIFANKDGNYKIRNEIVQKFILKFEKLFEENVKQKYFCRSLLKKIKEDGSGLNLKQDQKKSIQSNLVYSILKYFKWNEIVSFFKKNRSKVKLLKVSTFQEHVLKGDLFNSSQQKLKLKIQITQQMIQQAIYKLQNTKELYQNIFQRKAYIKLFNENIKLFEEKMILFVYKITQLKAFLKKYYHENYLKQGNDQDFIQDLLNQPNKLSSNNHSEQIYAQLSQTASKTQSSILNTSELEIQELQRVFSPIPLSKLQYQQFFFSKQENFVDDNQEQINGENPSLSKIEDEILNKDIEDIDQNQSHNQQST